MHKKGHAHIDFCNCLSSKKERFILENLSRIVEFARNHGLFGWFIQSLYILGNNRRDRILLSGLSLILSKIFFLTNEVNFDEIVKKCEERKSIQPLVNYLLSISPNKIEGSFNDVYNFLQPVSEELVNIETLVIHYDIQNMKANIYTEIGYPFCCKKPDEKAAKEYWDDFSRYAQHQGVYSVYGLKDFEKWSLLFYWWRSHLIEEYGISYKEKDKNWFIIIDLGKVCAKRLQKRDLRLAPPKRLDGVEVFYPKYFLENLLREMGYENTGS
jgi:hypothetical protein